jgi:predicted enzyme related to lactoylglutathione lyase
MSIGRSVRIGDLFIGNVAEAYRMGEEGVDIVAVGPVTQIHLSVKNIYSSIGFYRDILGLPFLFKVPDQPMAFFQSGPVRLSLGKPESPEQSTKVLLYFSVDDIDAEYARLSRIGVDFVKEPHVVRRSGPHEVWIALLRDPDGHHLGLMEERAAGG